MAAILAPLAVMAASGAAVAAGVLCERAGTAAEVEFGLPKGLLIAIGKVESGRWDPLLERVAPWPWAVNVAGAGNLATTRAVAIEAVRSAQAAGQRNIDVGCFQVNLLHHPNAFPTLDDAFDPTVNARYAARLLSGARARLGSWTAAVESYHSANPARGIPYGRSVIERWAGSPGPAPGDQAISAHGMKVWTPSTPGSAPGLISIAPMPAGRKAVVILPAATR